MEVHLVAQELSFTPSLREHLERRLRFAFTRTRNRIGRVVVRLRDVNGPRGGRDKLCQVSVMMPGRPATVVSEVHDDMYSAIDAAIRRAAYHASRAAAKLRRTRHRGRAPVHWTLTEDSRA